MTTPQCTATRTNGEPCRKRPMRGSTVCDTHGGMAPQVRAKAAERILEAQVNGELVSRGWESMTDPLAAYADLVGELWALKELCRERANELRSWEYHDDKGTEDVRARIVVYERALDRVSKALVDMMRLGLDAQALRQAKERPSREQAEVFNRILDHVLAGLGLSEEQRAAVPGLLGEAVNKEGVA